MSFNPKERVTIVNERSQQASKLKKKEHPSAKMTELQKTISKESCWDRRFVHAAH